MPNLNNLTAQDLQWGTANWSGQGYIDGLKMVWNSATSISVTSGAAFIPSLSKCLPLTTTLTLSGLVLAASTWYHLYLYLNAGAPAIECVTTAPAAAYYGTARTKTGDTSRRYIGSVLTDGSGNIFNFQNVGDRILYRGYLNQTPFTVLTNGTATSETSIDLAGVIPNIGIKIAILRNTCNGTGFASRLNNYSAIYPQYALNFGAGADAFLDFNINPDLTISYWVNAIPSGTGVNVQVLGYLYER